MPEAGTKERSATGIGALSISSPGMGGAGKLSASPSSKGSGSGSAWGSAEISGLTEMMEGGMVMVIRESLVATWSLWMRGEESGRAECIIVLFVFSSMSDFPLFSWLAQAELSTSPRSTKLLLRSVYLSPVLIPHSWRRPPRPIRRYCWSQDRRSQGN